jgi:hypothetical protein
MQKFINKVVLLFSTFFLIRVGRVNKTKLFFSGIASNTAELESFKVHDFYEKAMAERFEEDALKSELFFDIGGNIGNYNVLYTKVSKGVCYCWEPINYFRFLNIFNQILNVFSLKRFFLSKKFVGDKNDNTHENLNDFCSSNNLYPDLVKLDVEGAESIILPSLDDEFFSNLTLYLEFHVSQIKYDFNKDPHQFLNFLFTKFHSIEFNRNHWGDFKGIPMGSWENKSKDEISLLIEEILNDQSAPRGFGLILSNKKP